MNRVCFDASSMHLSEQQSKHVAIEDNFRDLKKCVTGGTLEALLRQKSEPIIEEVDLQGQKAVYLQQVDH